MFKHFFIYFCKKNF